MVHALPCERRARLSASEVPARNTNDGAHRCVDEAREKLRRRQRGAGW